MAISRDKQIILGVAVLAGLGGLVWRQMNVDAAKGSIQAKSAELPALAATPDEIDKISVTNGEKGETVLEKKADGKWALTKPVAAPANQQNVKSLLDNLKELKAKEVIAENPDEELKKTYELDAAHGVHIVAWKGDSKKVDHIFGKSGGRGEMVITEGKPTIYAAQGYASYLYAREVKGWRDTEVLKFEDANAIQVTLDNKAGGTFSFTKEGDKWNGTQKGRPIDRFDPEKVKDFVRVVHALNADDFGDGKSPAETGLDQPEATLTVTLKDNAGKFALKVGKPGTGTSRFATKDGDPQVYVLGAYASDFLTTDGSKFQKAVMSDAGAAKKPAAPDPHGHVD